MIEEGTFVSVATNSAGTVSGVVLSKAANEPHCYSIRLLNNPINIVLHSVPENNITVSTTQIGALIDTLSIL